MRAKIRNWLPVAAALALLPGARASVPGADAQNARREVTGVAHQPAGDPGWTPVDGLAHSMTLIVAVERNGTAMEDALDKVAVFAGPEVRGVAAPANLGDQWVFFVSAESNSDGESLSFRFYDASADEVVEICEGLMFQADATRGSIARPYTLHEDGASAPDCALSWDVASGFSSSMSIYASVHFFGIRSTSSDDRVIAFTGSEIRGVGVPFDAGGEQVYAIETWGYASGEQLMFRLYKHTTGLTSDAIQAATFTGGSTLGSPSDPFRLDADVELPIAFTSIQALTDGDRAIVSWEVRGETATVIDYRVEHQRVEHQRSPGMGHAPRRQPTAAASEAWTSVALVDGQSRRRYDAIIDDLDVGRHRFRVRSRFIDGAVSYSEEAELNVASPPGTGLSAPYPNPAREYATVTVSRAVEGHVNTSLYDGAGRLVAVLFDGTVPANTAVPVAIDARDLAGGWYAIVARGEGVIRTRALFVAH